MNLDGIIDHNAPVDHAALVELLNKPALKRAILYLQLDTKAILGHNSVRSIAPFPTDEPLSEYPDSPAWIIRHALDTIISAASLARQLSAEFAATSSRAKYLAEMLKEMEDCAWLMRKPLDPLTTRWLKEWDEKKAKEAEEAERTGKSPGEGISSNDEGFDAVRATYNAHEGSSSQYKPDELTRDTLPSPPPTRKAQKRGVASAPAQSPTRPAKKKKGNVRPVIILDKEDIPVIKSLFDSDDNTA